MRGEFTRMVNLKTVDVYAVIACKEERKDLQDYFKGDRSNQAVNKYLSSIGLLNNRNELTNKGHELVQTSKMFYEEEGKYRIWYIEEDELSDQKVLCLRREKYEKDSKLDSDVELSGIHNLIYLSTKQKNQAPAFQEIQFNEVESNCKYIDTISIQLNWDWEILESKFPIQTKYHYEGKIPKENINLKNYEFDYRFAKDDFILMLLTNGYKLDEASCKLMIEFEMDLYSVEEWKNFRINCIELKEKDFGKGNFGTARLYQVDAMPIDVENASKWKEYLVELDLKKGFMTKEKFVELQDQLNKKDAFISYSLPSDAVPDYLQKLKSNKDTKFDEYMNLAAPYDLDPFNNHPKPVFAFSIVSDDTKSYKEILSKLQTPGKQVSKIVYSDRYVETENQCKAFLTLIDAYRNLDLNSIVLFTKRDNFSEQEKLGLEILLIPNLVDSHERVLILIYTDGTSDLWKISRSIDFIHFPPNSEISKDTKGKTKNCTFVKITEKDIEPYIKERI